MIFVITSHVPGVPWIIFSIYFLCRSDLVISIFCSLGSRILFFCSLIFTAELIHWSFSVCLFLFLSSVTVFSVLKIPIWFFFYSLPLAEALYSFSSFLCFNFLQAYSWLHVEASDPCYISNIFVMLVLASVDAFSCSVWGLPSSWYDKGFDWNLVFWVFCYETLHLS